MQPRNDAVVPPNEEEAAVLCHVLEAVRRIRHGYVQLMVQDARRPDRSHGEGAAGLRVGVNAGV
jgi:hypothetical protein